MTRSILLAVALTLALAAPAAGQNGNGPYDPFPSPASPDSTPRFFREMGLDIPQSQLRAGRFEPGLAASPSRGPSERAGVGIDGPGLIVFVVVLAAAAAAGAALVVRSRGRRAGEVPSPRGTA